MNSAIKVVKHLAFYCVLLGAWQTVAALHLWPPYLFPAPVEVFASLRAGFDDLGRCTGAAPCTQCFPRGDLGAAGRKSAKHAQYLLVTFGYPVVWLERKSNLVCSCHGLNAF